MNYIEAKKIMHILLACGIKAEFQDERETEINVYDDSGCYLFDINSVEEWEELKKVASAITQGLNTRSEKEHGEN